MFQNDRYVTRGIRNTISAPMQNMLWYLIDSMDVESKDYLQVFKLRPEDGKQYLLHTQEEPSFHAEHLLDFGDTPIQTKIFVIDDGDHSTMLLAEEY